MSQIRLTDLVEYTSNIILFDYFSNQPDDGIQMSYSTFINNINMGNLIIIAHRRNDGYSDYYYPTFYSDDNTITFAPPFQEGNRHTVTLTLQKNGDYLDYKLVEEVAPA